MSPSPFYEDEEDYRDGYDYIENPSFPELSPAGIHILSFMLSYINICINVFINSYM